MIQAKNLYSVFNAQVFLEHVKKMFIFVLCAGYSGKIVFKLLHPI